MGVSQGDGNGRGGDLLPASNTFVSVAAPV